MITIIREEGGTLPNCKEKKKPSKAIERKVWYEHQNKNKRRKWRKKKHAESRYIHG